MGLSHPAFPRGWNSAPRTRGAIRGCRGGAGRSGAGGWPFLSFQGWSFWNQWGRFRRSHPAFPRGWNSAPRTRGAVRGCRGGAGCSGAGGWPFLSFQGWSFWNQWGRFRRSHPAFRRVWNSAPRTRGAVRGCRGGAGCSGAGGWPFLSFQGWSFWNQWGRFRRSHPAFPRGWNSAPRTRGAVRGCRGGAGRSGAGGWPFLSFRSGSFWDQWRPFCHSRGSGHHFAWLFSRGNPSFTLYLHDKGRKP